MTGLAEFRQAPAFARYVAVVAALAVNRSQPQAEAPTARQAAARGRVRGAVPIKDLLTPLFADPDTVLTLKQVRALCRPARRENAAMYRVPATRQLPHQLSDERRSEGRAAIAAIRATLKGGVA